MCREWKEPSEFNRSRMHRGGIDSRCKVCKRAQSRARVAAYVSEDPATIRICSKCGESKPLAEYHTNRSKPGGYQTECKACAIARGQRHYREHADEKHAYDRQYRAINRERKQAHDRAYYQRNAAAIRLRVRQYGRRRKAEDPSRWNHLHNLRWRRRAERLKAGGSYTLAEWHALCAQYGHRCLACGSTGRLEVDHVVPVSLGGSNTIANLQPLCPDCNRAKGTKTIDYRPLPADQPQD